MFYLDIFHMWQRAKLMTNPCFSILQLKMRWLLERCSIGRVDEGGVRAWGTAWQPPTSTITIWQKLQDEILGQSKTMLLPSSRVVKLWWHAMNACVGWHHVDVKWTPLDSQFLKINKQSMCFFMTTNFGLIQLSFYLFNLLGWSHMWQHAIT